VLVGYGLLFLPAAGPAHELRAGVEVVL
jgi:hypothetical protein